MVFVVCVLACLLGVMIPNAQALNVHGVKVTTETSVGERVDDNITFVSSKQKSDFITDLMMRLGVQHETKRSLLKLLAGVSQQFFASHNNFNNFSEDLSLLWGAEFSKLGRLDVQDSFVHAEEPRSFEDAFGRTSGRYAYYLNRVDVAGTRELTRQLDVTARYRNEAYEVSRRDLRDSLLHETGLETSYSISSATILQGLYHFSSRDFDPGSRAFIHTLTSGVRQFFTKQLYADGRLGVNFIDSFTNKHLAKPLFSASVTDEFNDQARARLLFTKDTSTTNSTQDLFSAWRGTGEVSGQLTKRLDGAASAFFGQGRYTTQDIHDSLAGLDMRLDYELTPHLKSRLGYTYSWADSDGSSRKYTRNTVFVGLTGVF